MYFYNMILIFTYCFLFTGKDRDISNEYKRDLTLVGVVTIVVVAHALYGIYKVSVLCS